MRPKPWVLVLLLALALPGAARADSNVGITALGGLFGRYPDSVEDPGGAVVLSRSLTMGALHRVLQLRADTHLLVGYGSSRTWYGLVGLTGGLDLYPLPWFSFDLRLGVAGGGQYFSGRAWAPSFGLWSTGAVALHPWRDRERRLFVVTSVSSLLTTGADPGNDCVFCYGLKGIGLGYETTY